MGQAAAAKTPLAVWIQYPTPSPQVGSRSAIRPRTRTVPVTGLCQPTTACRPWSGWVRSSAPLTPRYGAPPFWFHASRTAAPDALAEKVGSG